MRSFSSLALLLTVALLPARAGELGSLGTTYPVAEQSALELVLQRLRARERSGALQRDRQAAIQRSLASLRNPAPVAGLETVHRRAERLLDPTVHYAEAVRTEDGREVVPAGASINPLLLTRLSSRLLFFDGRDPEQVAAVQRLLRRAATPIKPILVGGSWLELGRAWKTRLYYDQQGLLSQRFGIRAVPCIVSQQGQALLLQEIPAKELR